MERDGSTGKASREQPSATLADAPHPRPRGPAPPSRAFRLRHRRMRVLFFTLASAWGFVIGSAVVIAALRFQIPSFEVRPPLLLVLVAAGLVSVAGGVLAAIAYRQSMGRKPPG